MKQGGSESPAYGINKSGVAAGSAINPGVHAYRWDATNGLVDLGAPTSQAYAINGSGQIVGYAFLPAGQHAVLWQ